MKILLINPPHTAIGSRVPDEHLPPLGLLAVGGPLIDAGHQVELLDADPDDPSLDQIADEVARRAPEAVLIGHSGSSSAHPTVALLLAALRARRPGLRLIYGGVFPTFHWREVLDEVPAIDVVVRGEGEATAVRLLRALEEGTALEEVPGIAFRRGGAPFATRPAPLIEDLDAYRVGWELVDHRRYSYWGDQRAVVMQFSRGCPHQCTYCGQRMFWRRWRHRDPKRFAAEIARLHREQGVQVFNLADENPTSSRQAWKALLEAIVAEGVKVTIVASTRAGDIVRDADLLPLYRRAGVARFLLGIESTDEGTLRKVRKGATAAVDQRAIQLLRQHGIISLATWVVGFEQERPRDFWRGLKQLLAYDPDQIQLLYATPHRWTPFAAEVAGQRVVQPDLRRWDHKHQVLATPHLPPWLVMALFKGMEATMQLRPRALLRALAGGDAEFRAAMRWYYRIGRKVWLFEWANFLLRERRTARGPTVREFWRGRGGGAQPPGAQGVLSARSLAGSSPTIGLRSGPTQGQLTPAGHQAGFCER